MPSSDTPARPTRHNVPDVSSGYAIIALSGLVFLLGGYAILFSAFLPQTSIPLLAALARDTHYKYFFVLLIPTTVYFVIANWVGWQYYRNS